jgi:D-amino-acid dehydrogenase
VPATINMSSWWAGGVMGVTTAYYLLKRGYKVTIIEKNDQVAQETSFQNGGK